MGPVKVPSDAFYGAQTQRAIDNFPVSGLRMPAAFIHALGLIKASCAAANLELKQIDAKRAHAIITAATEIAEGRHDKQFPVDVYQTGSGTSTNMNVNEVIARLASKGKLEVHPNDHVNMGQSSNDVIPTAIHVSAALRIEFELLPALERLTAVMEKKAKEGRQVVKTGRTHLMDAMPVTFAQEIGGWARQIRNGKRRVKSVMPRLMELAQGGTAVGTGVNATPGFSEAFCAHLRRLTKLAFRPKKDFFEGMGAQDAAVEASGQLRTLAVSLMKISNDLRWMNSGPLAGLGDIVLPALQPGSSIMPGKVNPVIPESTAMVCAQVMGNDQTIAVAGQSGNFQLNVMLPVIAYNLLWSIGLLANSSRLLGDKAIAGMQFNTERVNETLAMNPILVTSLNRRIGYDLGAKIAKQAFVEKRPVLDVAAEHSGLGVAELRKLLDPRKLTGKR